MKRILGIELGSTRIKAVLTDGKASVLALGSYEWENTLVNGLWSYSLDEVEKGIRESFASLVREHREKYGEPIRELSALGISAMMHGYLAFDKNGKLLVPFRTWRNTNTEAAASELTKEFEFNLPMRWSAAHYYQAVLDGEEHVKEVSFLTTLSGYVHYMLTGKKVIGVGDASGMFPISGGDFDGGMLTKFDTLLKAKGIETSFKDILPTVMTAGENAGTLTENGALWLDPTGELKPGCVLCPPEGDAGTGMVATCSVTPRTANVSAGTSGFLMAVLERPLGGYYKEIDVVTTPHGAPVAMVHVNNFASEITAWTSLFEEVITLSGGNMSRGELFDALYKRSFEADEGCGGLVGYNFLSGEPITDVTYGAPLIARSPDGSLTLANLMKMHLYSALGSLAIGCEILEKEKVRVDSVFGHGGFFKTPMVGQSAMSAALGAPVTVMQNAGEGGAWGIAVLALFTGIGGGDLETFLEGIFKDAERTTVSADEKEKRSFSAFLEKYRKGLVAARLMGEILNG